MGIVNELRLKREKARDVSLFLKHVVKTKQKKLSIAGSKRSDKT